MLIFILTFSLIAMINGYCETEETLKVKHYYELGCKPIQDKNGQIKSFACPDFTSFDKEKCHHHGNVYSEEATVEDKYLGFCESACVCGGYDESTDSPARFYCTRHYCDEYEPNKYSEQCIFQHSSVRQCCASKIICDEERHKDLHKCLYNNKTYYEEQFIYPTNECGTHRCICDKDFDPIANPSKNPKCEIKDKCDLELRYLDRFQLGCAPVYFGKVPSCPGDQYRCPSENDRIIPGSRNDDDDGEGFCTFGELSLKKGDKLDDNCYNCTCIVPPILFCRQANAKYC